MSDKIENSQLEKLSDKILILILNRIKSDLGGDSNPDIDSDEFNESLSLVLTSMGISNHNPIDYEFIFELYIDNFDSSFESPLDRPVSSTYSVIVDVTTYETVVTSYKHIVQSYNPRKVVRNLKSQFNGGDYFSWEGEEIHREVMDSSTDSEIIDKSSIEKIR